ncbi:tetratricopeptide repeat protein [Glaciecola sp. SC05]|uniref:tetratricopeptide repeat protein n=1 Tax=Glaciecola sp. SC05 TaxID=1987355 RepID=UPI003526CEA1
MKLLQCFLSKSRLILCSLLIFSTTGTVSSVASLLITSTAVAQEETKLGDRKTRRTPALRATVYEQLARAQSAGDAGNVEDAIAILDLVKSKADSMNSYERAMMYNFYGFIYYNEERFDETIEAFQAAIEEQPIPVSFEQTTIFSLAQLSMMQGQYDKVVGYLERWESLNDGKIPPKNYILKAQALYQNKQFSDAARYIEEAIVNHEEAGFLPDENWLTLQRAIYFEMKEPEKVKDIIAKLIRLYDEPKYWIQLAGMYGELGREKEQLATMEVAYQRGFINSASDTYNLAQLYYYHGVPYKGAKLMEDAIASGLLEENLRNLKFLGQSWQRAKEEEKAVPVMQQAAQMSDDGKIDAQLALLYFNLEQYDKAIDAANVAIQKGDLDNIGNTHMVLGLALYNTRQFARALDELAKAESFAGSRGAARQWSKYVEKEKSTYESRLAIEGAP